MRADPLVGALTVLGIETSCDETAAAVVRRDAEGAGGILANVVLSQTREHAAFGGVVPEIAARAHIEHLDGLIGRAMAEAGLDFPDLDGIAATAGPGLIGGLIVGLMTAKALAMATGKPLLAINHLEAHALTPGLTERLAPPYLLLLVSGGHTQTLAVEDVGSYRRYGTTVDDALGEAFDKTAKLLGLPHPGGPAVESAASAGDPLRFDFPRPLKGKPGCNFSFSGLKTAVRQAVSALGVPSHRDIADICASFEAAVMEAVEDRLKSALARFRDEHPALTTTSLVVSGGVAANRRLRSMLEGFCGKNGLRLSVPPPGLCTDNAAMVAWAGAERLVRGMSDALDHPARPRWPLDPTATPQPFAGVKA